MKNPTYRLLRVTAQGIKGGSFDFEFGAANVIVGDNFAGKTRVLEAIQLVLAGYVPAFGKEARAAFLELASGPELSVQATLVRTDDPLELSKIKLGITLTAKGNSVTVNRTLPEWWDERAKFLPVLMDANVYLDLGATDRVRWVFDNCAMPEAFTTNAIFMRLRDKVPAWNFDESEYEKEGDQPDRYVEAMIEQANGDKKRDEQFRKRMEETIRGITGLRAGDRTPDDTLAELQTKRADAQQRLTALAEKKGLMNAEYRTLTEARARREEIRRQLMGSDKDRLRDSELRQRIEALASEIPAVPVDEEELTQAREAMNNAEANGRDITRRIHEATAKINKANGEISKIDGLTICPFCGATGDGWKTLKLAELAQEVSAQEEAIGELRKRLDQSNKLGTTIRQGVGAIEDRLRRQKDLIRTRDNIGGEINILGPRIARYKALEEERDRLKPEDDTLESTVQTVQGDINVVNEDIRAIDRDIAVANARKAELARLAQAEAERDKAAKDVEAATAAEKELKIIKSEMVGAAFGPLLDRANDLFSDVMSFRIEYNAAKATLGTSHGGNWRSYKAFSGVEKALTFAALQAALATDAPIRILMIDELGRLTKENAGRFALCIQKALALGVIDSFVGVDPERETIYEKRAFKVLRAQ